MTDAQAAAAAQGESSLDLGQVQRDFDAQGCGLVPRFCSQEECQELRQRIVELVREWAEPPPEQGGVFRTDEGQTKAQGAEDYFISSACKVRFFWEANAAKQRDPEDPEKTLLQLNKIGHGLHECDPSFKRFSHSDKVRKLVHALGWKCPVLPQSMYIVKNPVIGGEVTAHQDSSFLFTEPKPTCLGLWLALDDCDLENGCLWYRPGSHSEPVRRQFRREVDPADGVVKMNFKQLVPDEQMSPLEGKSVPLEGAHDTLKQHGFIPVECKAGDLVLIHGQVEHLSLPNTSTRPRHSFQLHLVDSADGVEWSPQNWLQYPAGQAFAAL